MTLTPRAVAVFTGSSPGLDPGYADATAVLGRALARADIGVVFGGGRVGLMGVVADAAMEAGGHVTGVIPDGLFAAEVPHRGVSELLVVPDMHTRKAQMAARAGAFVALPGGIGTLEEFFEAWTWLQLGIHDKPVALYNIGGFWDPLLEMIERMCAAGFLSRARQQALLVADTPEDLIAAL